MRLDWRRIRYAVGGGLLAFCAAYWLYASLSFRGSAPFDLAIEVFNQSRAPGSVEWRTPGLLGSPLFARGRAETVSACGTFSWAFDPGPLEVTIRSGTSHLAVNLDGDPRSPEFVAFVIRAGGTAEELFEAPGAGDPSRVRLRSAPLTGSE